MAFRLTELVRRSSDLFLIVNAERQLAYVSPASEAVLGVSPHELQCRPALRLLGSEHEHRFAAFLDDMRAIS